MSLKKQFSPMTRVLNKFVRTFDEEYSCKFGSDFLAVNDESITYTIAISDRDAISFQKDFIRRFPRCADFNIFTLSFMHELGHLETALDTVNDIKQREEISAMQDHDKAMRKYYALHNERIATNWAGKYLTEHHDDMKQWETKVLKTLQKILDKTIEE